MILILVAVTVRTVIQSGLFRHAQIAADKWERAQEEEQNLLNELDTEIEDAITPKTEDPNPGELVGDGTEENPYLICSIEDLVALSYNTNTLGNEYEGCYFELPITLNFESDKSYVDPNRTILQVGENIMYGSETNTVTLKEYLNTVGFFPIGLLCSVNINGKNNSICNLCIHNPDTNYIGLFQGFYESSSKTMCFMENLTVTGKIELDDSYVFPEDASDGDIELGSLAAETNYLSVSNCHSSVEISVKNLDLTAKNGDAYIRRTIWFVCI